MFCWYCKVEKKLSILKAAQLIMIFSTYEVMTISHAVRYIIMHMRIKVKNNFFIQ